MPPPLSMDLRQRIVEAYQAGEGSSRQLAQRFCVANSTVWLLTKHLEVRGTLEPLPNRGRETFWQEAQQKALKKVVNDTNDATLQQMADALAPVVGRQLDTSAVWRGLDRMGLSRKKKTFTPANATGQKSKRSG